MNHGSLRILWLSPWMRTLARVQAEALAARGHEVLLVTSDQHPASDGARDYELVLDPRPKTVRTWREFGPAWRRVRAFEADVVICELVRDPRWTALAAGRPRVDVVHDDRPHGADEQRRAWEHRVFDRWGERAAARVVFSRYVADAIGSSTGRTSRVVPLTSDLAEAEVPAFVPASDRRDFTFFGRLRAYKNLDVALDAWRVHVSGPGWRGDELLVIGDGDLSARLPPHARHVAGAYSYAAVLPLLARAKGSLVHYRQASQSGVQVLSQQLGVTPIVSPAGALPQFQPAGELPIDVDDVAALASALDMLADPVAAATRGARARAHFVEHFDATVVAREWERVLRGALDESASG